MSALMMDLKQSNFIMWPHKISYSYAIIISSSLGNPLLQKKLLSSLLCLKGSMPLHIKGRRKGTHEASKTIIESEKLTQT
jgi:hypothetical protein